MLNPLHGEAMVLRQATVAMGAVAALAASGVKRTARRAQDSGKSWVVYTIRSW
jgi:hypothetical protein